MKSRDVIVDWFDKRKLHFHTPYDVADNLINYLDKQGWKIVHKETDAVLDPEEMKQFDIEMEYRRSIFVDERCAFCEMPWAQSPTPTILSRWSEKTKTFSEKKGFCNSSCLAQWIESECYSDQG